MVEIVEGKFYRTRDFRKVGPMKMLESGVGWVAESGRIETSCDYDWYKNGTYGHDGAPHKLDLIEEYKDNAQMFKVGDRVRDMEWNNGAHVGTIVEVFPDDKYTPYRIDYSPHRYGVCAGSVGDNNSNLVLVETVPSSPVQSRKTLVPGVYGRVKINDYPAGTGIASVQWQGSNLFTANELREVIRVLGEVAEFLEDEGK